MLQNMEGKLSHIPPALRIRILFEDDSIVVVDKPPNLRSVHGHAQPSTEPTRKRKREGTGYAQDTWIQVIQSFAARSSRTKDQVDECLQRMAAQPTNVLKSVPRRQQVFRKYFEHNRMKILDENDSAEFDVDQLAQDLYERLKRRQAEMLDMPEPTSREESALGQLSLLGIEGQDYDVRSGEKQLHVVHRLDCATSGVMVFAKTHDAVSNLSRAWRERDAVQKVYLAQVQSWPPLTSNGEMKGQIDLAMSPSEERLKWKVCAEGKPSTTLWRVLDPLGPDDEYQATPVTLELMPLTGRTHQLRVHCAAVGSGIIGDTLYGSEQASFDSGSRLHLHARKLSFPHPQTGKEVSFATDPDWKVSSIRTGSVMPITRMANAKQDEEGAKSWYPQSGLISPIIPSSKFR